MIVISSYKGSPFLQGCLDSIPADIPHVVWMGGGYEAGGLRFVQKMDVDEVFFMQDSARIKDPQWIRAVLAHKGHSYCVNNESGPYSMYTGKVRLEVLRKLAIPETTTKLEAVIFEVSFGEEYARIDPGITVLWPELNLDNATDGEVFGRPVKVYENEHFLKYKSCWGGWMVGDCCARDQEYRALCNQ